MAGFPYSGMPPCQTLSAAGSWSLLLIDTLLLACMNFFGAYFTLESISTMLTKNHPGKQRL